MRADRVVGQPVGELAVRAPGLVDELVAAARLHPRRLAPPGDGGDLVEGERLAGGAQQAERAGEPRIARGALPRRVEQRGEPVRDVVEAAAIGRHGLEVALCHHRVQQVAARACHRVVDGLRVELEPVRRPPRQANRGLVAIDKFYSLRRVHQQNRVRASLE